MTWLAMTQINQYLKTCSDTDKSTFHDLTHNDIDKLTFDDLAHNYTDKSTFED